MMTNCTLRLALCLTVGIAIQTDALHAQSYQGGVRGLVTDVQGAIVPKAKVNLTDRATRITRSSVTNSDGQFAFTAVEPSTYTVSITAPGFATVERSTIVLGPQQFLVVDLTLSPSAITQQVEVSGSAPLIDQADASNSEMIDTRKIEDLPVPSRNPYLTAKLLSNVIATGTPSGSVRFADQTGLSYVSIAGSPLASNNYLIDGVPITDLNNRPVIVPSIEAVADLTIQQSSYDAEVGRTGGGTLTTFLKSGSDRLHGTLYGETRQTNWTAKPYFYTTGTVLDATLYDYAGAIGGPVRVPYLYDGRHKTFFWIAEEGYRQRVPVTGKAYVPTALERTGNFSQSSRKIYNPFAPLVPCAAPSTQLCRQQFPNNTIRANLINPVGLAVANSFPQPTQTVTQYGTTNYSGTVVELKRADNFSAKLDHQLFPWWSTNLSYIHFGSNDPSASALQIQQAGTALLRKVDAVFQHNTITLSPTTLLTVGYGFNRFPNRSISFTEGYNQAALGFPSSYAGALQGNRFPQISMQTAASLGANTPNGVAGNSVFYSRSLVAGLAKSFGRHSVTLGYDFRSLSVDFLDTSFGNGLYSFTNIFSEQLPNAGTTATGADVADLLLGTPASGQVTVASPLRLNVRYHAAYLQDNVRVTRSFTFTAGVRYEYELGIRERSNQLAVGFDRNAVNPLSTSSGLRTLGGVEFAGIGGYPVHCCNNSHLKVAPRVGLVFSPRSNLSVRAGYGIFYAPLFYTNSSLLAPGYTQTNTYVASNDGNVTPANTLSNPFPSGLQLPSGNSQGYLTGVGNSLTVLDQYRRTPVLQQYSLDIQQALPGNLVFEIGYTGSKGRNLQSSTISLGTYNINQLQDQYLSLGSQLASKVTNPYYNHGGSGVIGSSTIAYNQLLRPFPGFSSVNIAGSTAQSAYNALNLKLERQMLHGVSVLAGYTWASNWDSAWGTTSSINSGPTAPQDPSNLRAEYARAINDIPNRFSAGAIVELPFGPGKRFLRGTGLLERLIGGWSANGVVFLQSGSPLAVYQNSNNNSSIGAGVQRPNLIGNPCYTGSPQSRINNYVNGAAFATAPAYTYGNSPRTLPCYGPGIKNLDFSLFKNFEAEGFNFQFRAEALNAFNTPQFAGPVVTLGSATFGQILNTVNLPRYIQLGGKVSF